jgi:hypothetical protein
MTTVDTTPVVEAGRIRFATTIASLRAGPAMPVLDGLDLGDLSTTFVPAPQLP